jgi:MYXO-CTERM domain-containing protein
MAVGETAVTWRQELTSSSEYGDKVLLDTIGRRYVATEYGVNTSPGACPVSGSPVSAVPEPDVAGMLLAGLASLAALRRRHFQRI